MVRTVVKVDTPHASDSVHQTATANMRAVFLVWISLCIVQSFIPRFATKPLSMKLSAVKQSSRRNLFGFITVSALAPLVAAAPAFALREPAGLAGEVGKGKYDSRMDPLYAAAVYGTGKAQIEARKAIRASGKEVPKPASL